MGLLINWFLKQYATKLDRGDGDVWQGVTPWVVCMDGLIMSVQARKGIYCEPRVDFANWYDTVEVFNVIPPEPMFAEYGDGTDPYEYVSVELVDAVLAKHGGINWDAIRKEPATKSKRTPIPIGVHN